MKTLEDIKLEVWEHICAKEEGDIENALRLAIDHLHTQNLLMVWNTDMDSAPRGDLIVVTGGTYSSESTGSEFYNMPFNGRAVVEWNQYLNEWRGCDCDNMVYYPTAWMPLPTVQISDKVGM